MTRPIYESEQDRQNEIQMMPVLQTRFKCTVQRNKRLFCADYSFLRGKSLVAIGDLKRRYNPMRKYPDYMISAIKFHEGRALSTTLKIPFILVVQWDDATGYLNLHEVNDFTLSIGGRTDRNDEQDIEPLVHINLETFKVIA